MGNADTRVKYAQIMFDAMSDFSNSTGYKIATDGIYGSNMRAQATATQRWYNSWHSNKVAVDGITGGTTWTIMCIYTWDNSPSTYGQKRADAIGPIACT